NAFVFSFPLANFNYKGISNTYSIFGLLDRESGEMIFTSWITPSLAISSMLLCLVAILLFKRRGGQVKMAQLALVFQTAFVAAIFFFIDKTAVELGRGVDM